MPRYKLPKSLFKIALEKVDHLVYMACHNIETRYRSYDEPKCKQAVKLLQQYLLSNIPGIVLDQVCEERMRNRYHFISSQPHDFRIILAVYLHKSMRTFYVADARLNIDDIFWCSHLKNLSNLVVLDMHLTCSDEILEVVGQNCVKLEQINIVSRLAPERVKINARFETFNALKLRFFISDEGLGHLSNCRQLKKITMNKMLRSNFGGRMMTDAGIRKLIKSLPCIQTVTYDDMGIVISQDMDDVESLPLTYVSDYHPQPSHIAAASLLCKNLQHLCLHLPSQTNNRTMKSAEILQALTNSDVKVSVLDLFQFPVTEQLFAFLEEKGHYLRNFLLQTGTSLTAGTITFIGRCCPKLKALELKEVLLNTEQVEPRMQLNSLGAEPLFTHLQCLYIWGNRWNPEAILPVCLLHAKQLESLTLMKSNDYLFLDEVITKILSNNPLTELKVIRFLRGCLLSLTTLRYFLKHCPHLYEMSFMKHSDIRDLDVQGIHHEIRHYNFNLIIHSVEQSSTILY